MRILILGCGWVGEEFANYAISSGCQVVATTTKPEKCKKLAEMGIQPILHNFDSDEALQLGYSEVDYVLNSIPASKKMDSRLVERRFRKIQNELRKLSFKKQIYLSSIGIYPDVTGVFDENYPDVSSLDKTLFAAEELMQAVPSTLIYRLGGLFGKERIFAKYFEDNVCTTGDQLANFVHLDDVVRLIWLGMTENLVEPIYNIVAPLHPCKKDVILASASRYRFRLPSSFEPQDSFRKIVNGNLIAKELGYVYKYASPLEF